MSENELLKILQSCFPQEQYSDETVVEAVTSGELIVSAPAIANHLQGALHDESLLEVELGNLRRVFFARVLDHPPEEDDDFFADMPYGKGEYLDEGEHVILTPLEPAEGNYLINSGSRLLLRLLTTQAALEFCCRFEQKIKIGPMPVLQLTFPEVGRHAKGAREYRVKIPQGMDLKILVQRKNQTLRFTTRPMDMSVSGMCLYDPAGKKTELKTDDRLELQVVADDMVLMSVDAVVRHVTRLRDAGGLQYVFGTKLMVETRPKAAKVEKLVADIQRARLRELVEIEDEYGLELSNW